MLPAIVSAPAQLSSVKTDHGVALCDRLGFCLYFGCIWIIETGGARSPMSIATSRAIPFSTAQSQLWPPLSIAIILTGLLGLGFALLDLGLPIRVRQPQHIAHVLSGHLCDRSRRASASFNELGTPTEDECG